MFYIKLKFFGIFKDYLDDEIYIEVSDNLTVLSLKKKISEKYFVNNLNFLNKILFKSLISSNNCILSDNDLINSGDLLNILPPFSGG